MSEFISGASHDFIKVGRNRSVQIAIAFTVLGLTIYGLGGPQIPAIAEMVPEQISGEFVLMPQFLVLSLIIYLITRNRTLPDFVARSPARDKAVQDLVIFGLYYFVAIIGLASFGITYHPPDLLAEGVNFGAQDMINWMTINFIFYGAIPYLFFRWRGSSNIDLGLAGNNWSLDIWPLLAIGGIDAFFAITTRGFLSLTPSQMVSAVPLTLIMYGLGAGIPIVIMTQAIVAPRIMMLTNSPITTVIVLTFTYAMFSSTDGGIVFESGGHAFYVILFWVTRNMGPGLVKAMLTVRTGNSWLHMIAFHVVSFHIWADAPTVAFLFGLQ
ncbi:MAG: hypothetical protein AAF490_10540 [Chloroflexota bacterium]